MIKGKRTHPALRYGLLCAIVPVLASCTEAMTFKAVTAGVTAAAYGVFSDPDVNLKAKNYAAADYLVSQMKSHVSAYAPILVTPLEERDHAGITSEFGRAVPEEIGLRFMTLGYKVWLHAVAPQGGVEDYPAPPEGKNPAYRLGGSYYINDDEIDVVLRVTEVKTGRIVARFNYMMPLSREIKELAKTEPRIYRLP